MSPEEKVQRCPVCNRPLDEGCKPLKQVVNKTEYYEYLTPPDWEQIRELYHKVYLPTLHSYLARAKARHEEEEKESS